MMSRRIKFNDSYKSNALEYSVDVIEAEEVLSVEKFVNEEKKIVSG